MFLDFLSMGSLDFSSYYCL